MKTNSYLIAYFFLVLVLMSCKKDPGIKVHGSVQDYKTQEGIADIALKVVKGNASWSGTTYETVETLKTDNVGNFSLNLKTDDDFGYSIFINEDLKKHGLVDVSSSFKLVLGSNTANFKVKRLINLTVRLINKSNHNRENFKFQAGEYYNSYYAKSTDIVKDTLLSFKVPRWSNITLASIFYPSSGPGISTISFSQYFNTENSDAHIVVTNP